MCWHSCSEPLAYKRWHFSEAEGAAMSDARYDRPGTPPGAGNGRPSSDGGSRTVPRWVPGAERRRRRRVVVVGAGPTGLLLAGDLSAAGVETLVLERRGVASNLTRAFAVHARTLEVLDARGLADDLVAAGRPVRGLRL